MKSKADFILFPCKTARAALSLFSAALLSACAARPQTDSAAAATTGAAAPVSQSNSPTTQPHGGARRIPLQLEGYWQLNLPRGERFDASGLFEQKDGVLLTINDREAAVYKINFRSDTNSADLIQVPDCFTARQLASFAKEKIDRYDIEGITGDDEGRIYLSEEANRWILRWSPKTKTVDRLEIDWSPVQKYFHPTDRNASFEGVAVGGGRIYVANERQSGRIIVVDQKTLKVIDDFMPRPSTAALGDIHYSDLSWFDGHLYVLLRHHKVVLMVDPTNHAIIGEYTFGSIEDAPETAYRKFFPTGTMEGLAVDKDFFWLATDNNGFARVKYSKDIRPTLFKCRRPAP
jgi:uncharacterized protein YjiK